MRSLSWGPDTLRSLNKNQNEGVGVRFLGPITKRSKISEIYLAKMKVSKKPTLLPSLPISQKKASAEHVDTEYLFWDQVGKEIWLSWWIAGVPPINVQFKFLKVRSQLQPLSKNEDHNDPATKFGKTALKDTERLDFISSYSTINQTKKFLKGYKHFFLQAPTGIGQCKCRLNKAFITNHSLLLLWENFNPLPLHPSLALKQSKM